MTGRDEGDVGELRPSPGCRVHGLQSLQRYSIVQRRLSSSLGPRPKTNPSTDRLQYRVFPRVILHIKSS